MFYNWGISYTALDSQVLCDDGGSSEPDIYICQRCLAVNFDDPVSLGFCFLKAGWSTNYSSDLPTINDCQLLFSFNKNKTFFFF